MLYYVCRIRRYKYFIIALIALLIIFSLSGFSFNLQSECRDARENFIEQISDSKESTKNNDYIKWIDLNTDSKSLSSVLSFCLEFRKNGTALEFCEVLAFVAIKNGNSFSGSSTNKYLKELRNKLNAGVTIDEIAGSNKYYNYYKESYRAIFSGIVGEFTRAGSDKIEYGISGFFPLAKGYHYTHYDDFGAKRGYGYARRHLGHDFMGSVGTPIVAIEGGIVTELGWNQYGGWRVGIRSLDTNRYYYYAHLRKDNPFAKDLSKGDRVHAGQLIGFLGNTGYSTTENKNLKTGNPHLHLGMQIIFDECQVKGPKEIWVDLYAISKFLSSDKAIVKKENGEMVSKSIKLPVERIVEPMKL